MPEQWTAPWPEPPSTRRLPMNRGPSPPPMRGGPYPPLHMAQPTLPPLAMPPPRGPPPRIPLPQGPPFITNLESTRDQAPQPINLNSSAPRPTRARSPPPGPPGPSGPSNQRDSWYGDITHSYEAESYYEPSVKSPSEKAEGAKEEAMEDSSNSQEDLKRPLTKRQRYVKHLRRRWYFYAVGLIIGLAVGLPIMFLVVLPAIVQHMVDQAPFPLLAVSLTDPSPNNYLIGMKSALNIPGGFQVELDPTSLTLAQMEPNGTGPSFAGISLPSYQLKGNTTLNVPPQNVTIHDHEAFIGFIHTAAVSETYQLTTNGKSVVRMGALHSNINIDKTLTVPGFNNFKGFSVPDAQLLLTPQADGTNILGHATLPNPTVITIELGDFNMNMMCGDIHLGVATISNLVLKPGNTTMPLKGKIDIDAVFNNLGELLTLQEQGLAQGALMFNATMNSTTFNGVNLVDFEKAFADLVLTASLPITEVVGDSIKGFLGGNTSLEAVTGELMNYMNISDISSMLKPAEDKVESMVEGFFGDKSSSSSSSSSSSLFSEVINDLVSFVR